jgi:hypothetical protein
MGSRPDADGRCSSIIEGSTVAVMRRTCPDVGARYAPYSRFVSLYAARRPREPGRAPEQAFYRETTSPALSASLAGAHRTTFGERTTERTRSRVRWRHRIPQTGGHAMTESDHSPHPGSCRTRSTGPLNAGQSRTSVSARATATGT